MFLSTEDGKEGASRRRQGRYSSRFVIENELSHAGAPTSSCVTRQLPVKFCPPTRYPWKKIAPRRGSRCVGGVSAVNGERRGEETYRNAEDPNQPVPCAQPAVVFEVVPCEAVAVVRLWGMLESGEEREGEDIQSP